MSSILIKNGYVINVEDGTYSKMDVLIEENIIKKVEKNIDINADKIIDVAGNVVMPGFVNAHMHSPMSIFRGYSDDCSLYEWLNEKIFPIEAKLNDEIVYYATMLSCIEMIKSGTTCFNDMYLFTDMVAKAVKDSKIRASLGRTIFEVSDDNDESIKKAIDIVEKYNNTENGRITSNITAHALYTCNEKAILNCIKLAKKYNVPFHIHLDETKKEHEDIKNKYGVTPLGYLKEKGAFDVPLILAHSVWLDDKDILELRNIKGGIVHNPISNSKLASGIAPIKKYMDNGILIALGTDGDGSTNTLDMFEEMKLCSYLQKISTLDPTCISARDVVKFATINGAKILNINDIGSIKVGNKADVIIVDMKNEHQIPVHDIFSNLAYSTNGNDVITTIVDGNILMENRKLTFIDENEIYQKCNQIKEKLFK